MKQKHLAFYKSIGGMVAAVAVLSVVLFVSAFFIQETVQVYVDYISDITNIVDHWVFLLTLLFLLLCMFRKCRIWAGGAVVYCTYFLGLVLWLDSLTITYSIFGGTGVFVGIALLGVGIFVTGLFALLWTQAWLLFWWFLLTGAVIYCARIAGLYIEAKETERRYASYLDELDSEGNSEVPLVKDIIDADLSTLEHKRESQRQAATNFIILQNLSFPVGRDYGDKEVFVDFATHRLMLLVGETGSGKSIFHENLYRQIMKEKMPQEVGFIFLDMTRIETWEGPHTLLRETHPLKSIELLEALARDDSNPIKHIFIHIEECDMFMNHPDRTEKAVEIILKNRKDITVVYSTSRPSSYGPLRKSLLALADVKVVFHQTSTETYKYILGYEPKYLPKNWEKLITFDYKESILQPFSQSYAHEISQSYEGFGTRTLSEANIVEGERLRSLVNKEMADEEVYNEAKNLVIEQGHFSLTLMTNRLHLDSARAAHIMDLLEKRGVIEAADGAKPRKVIPKTQ